MSGYFPNKSAEQFADDEARRLAAQSPVGSGEVATALDTLDRWFANRSPIPTIDECFAAIRHLRASLQQSPVSPIQETEKPRIPEWCNPIRNDDEHKASLAVIERLIDMNEGTRTPEQDQELNVRATLIHEYESKRYPLYTAKDVRNAARWQTLEPFLVVDHDGDETGSWYSLSIRDRKTGVDSIEIYPREKPTTPASFMDCLIEGDSLPMPTPMRAVTIEPDPQDNRKEQDTNG